MFGPLYMGLALLGSLRAWPFEWRVSASQLSSTARLSAKPDGGAFGIKFHDAKWMIICDYTANRQWEPQQILEAKDTTTSTHGCLCECVRVRVCNLMKVAAEWVEQELQSATKANTNMRATAYQSNRPSFPHFNYYGPAAWPSHDYVLMARARVFILIAKLAANNWYMAANWQLRNMHYSTASAHGTAEQGPKACS